jgi:hypothetical protein
LTPLRIIGVTAGALFLFAVGGTVAWTQTGESYWRVKARRAETFRST